MGTIAELEKKLVHIDEEHEAERLAWAEKEKELLAKVADLEKENENLRTKVTSAVPVLSGTVVYTKNQKFSGQTLGVRFLNGRAFIPDGQGHEQLLKDMEFDFGYQMQHVDNWLDFQPETQPEKSMIDVLALAQKV